MGLVFTGSGDISVSTFDFDVSPYEWCIGFWHTVMETVWWQPLTMALLLGYIKAMPVKHRKAGELVYWQTLEAVENLE